MRRCFGSDGKSFVHSFSVRNSMYVHPLLNNVCTIASDDYRFGFNGGSAVAANNRAAYAILATHISASVGALSWMVTEWLMRGKPSVLGIVSGAVAGLVTVTPACGYITPTGAFVCGVLGGPICYFGAQMKHRLGYDDALDAFVSYSFLNYLMSFVE